VVDSGIMRRLPWVTALGLTIIHSSLGQDSVSVERAAMKYLPGVDWQPRAVVSGNFSCHGRKERAILGVSASEILIAVFVNGLNMQPEVLRYSAKARSPKSAELKIEDLDYDPKEIIGSDLDGFKRSKSCKGLNLSDGETDPAHIYWNHKSQRFEDWTL